MNIKEKAKLYAIEAHKGQVRKADPRKPMIIHPINVANILESYGFDDNVIAAGYLHDVVEDTPHTMEDIEKEFGEDIASLVTGDNEPDKNWTWEQRKKYTIDTIKNLDLRHKAIVCADKISNLEDSKIDFGIKGKVDFSSFKRGFESQQWYFSSIYESLIYNEDENHPMFKRLRDLIEYVFYSQKKQNLTKEELSIHYRIEELLKLKSFVETTPYVIEFMGFNNRKTIMNNIKQTTNKLGLNVEILEESEDSKDIVKVIDELIEKNPDIILIDRSLINKLINLEKLLKKNEITLEEYDTYKKYQLSVIKDKLDLTLAIYENEVLALKRKNIEKIGNNKKVNILKKQEKPQEEFSLEVIEYIINNIREDLLSKVNDQKELIKKK